LINSDLLTYFEKYKNIKTTMKKTLLLLSVCVGFALAAAAQCAPDTTHFTSGQYVYPTTLACIERHQAYTGTQTIKVPDSLSYTVPVVGTVQGYIDSVRIDSISGEPSGITSASSPALGTWIHHGRYACAFFSGTTSAPAGNYQLTISGRACGHFTAPVVGRVDTCTNYTFTRSYPDTLKVCNPAGISDLSSGLNLNIYPNPNQGNFTVTIAAASRLTGTMSVLDQLGRTITTQSLDINGTKDISLALGNVSSGAYLLVINTENGRSVKQFIVK
jgi:hypothetical protein